MRMRRYTLAAAIFLAATVLSIGGCSLEPAGGDAAAATAETKRVSIGITGINGTLARTMAAVSAANSRAFMFVDRLEVYVYDYTDGTYPVYGETLDLLGSSQGPGSGQYLNLDLVSGRNYSIYVYGYNDRLATGGYFYGYSSFSIDPTKFNDINVNLMPTSPGQLTVGTSTTSVPMTQSLYDQYALPDGEFTSIGGEAWYSFTATSEVTTVDLDPSADFLYASLYSVNGDMLDAGISPSFMGGATDVATILAGTTAGQTYYVGFVPIANDPGPAADVTVNIFPQSAGIADDSYEPDDSLGYAKGINLSVAAPYVASYPDLKAFDEDWFYVYPSIDGILSVTATITDTMVPLVYGSLEIMDWNGGTIASIESNEWIWDEATQTALESPGVASFTASVDVATGTYYYIRVKFRASDANFGFPILAGSYSLSVTNSAAVASTFALPVIGNVRKGQLLVNKARPQKMTYLWLDTNGAMYSQASSDGGSTWAASIAVGNTYAKATDFVADMDSVGNALFLSTHNDPAAIPAAAYDAVLGYNWSDTNYWNWTWSWGTSVGGGAAEIGFPSVSRTDGGDILFGYGYDLTAPNLEDGVGGHSAFWNGYYQQWSYYYYVPLSGQTDNVWNQQVFADTNGRGSYYLSMDNHYDWNSQDLFAIAGSGLSGWGYNETLVLDAPSGSNAGQPWMARSAADYLLLVYALESGGMYELHVRSAGDVYGLAAAADDMAIATGVAAPDYAAGVYKTVRAIPGSNGNMHVAWVDTTGSIFRAKISQDPTSFVLSATPINVGVSGTIDGLAFNSEGGMSVLYVSSHDAAGNAQVTRIENP